jgi:hypothetical protein
MQEVLMYFIIRPDLKTWRGKMLMARSEPLLKDCEPHWWLAQPLTKTPERFKLFILKDGPKLDNYSCGSGIDVYSKKMIDVIADHGVSFETVPVDVFDSKSKEKLDVEYFAFHLLEIYPSINLEESMVAYYEESPGAISAIKNMVLKEEILEMPKPLFRMEELFGFVLIHQSLKNSFEKAGITGCKYISIDDFHVGYF